MKGGSAGHPGQDAKGLIGKVIWEAYPGLTGSEFERAYVLVVDDNRDAADSLSMILKVLGADVRIARDGSEAIEAFPSYAPTSRSVAPRSSR